MDKRRALLFEDSKIFADVLLHVLNEQGYETQLAKNGLEGIKLVYSFLPEIIITAVEMPLFKGCESVRFLKSRPATWNIPIIMLTNAGETKDKFWGEQAGADVYIEKTPENIEELSKQIRRLLDENRLIDYERIKKEAEKINDNSL